jgi:hypothetical protein
MLVDEVQVPIRQQQPHLDVRIQRKKFGDDRKGMQASE